MNINSTIFSPLNKDSCIYFYILMIIFFVVMVITVMSGLLFAVTKPSKINFSLITHFILIIINIFLVYFVNRLYYSMCVNSLK